VPLDRKVEGHRIKPWSMTLTLTLTAKSGPLKFGNGEVGVDAVKVCDVEGG